MVAGDQLPVIPFEDVSGKMGAALPWQIEAGIELKTGVGAGETVMLIVWSSAHGKSTELGVKV